MSQSNDLNYKVVYNQNAESIPYCRLFVIVLGLFKQTVHFLLLINLKICLSSIQCWDLNPMPLEYDSSPITTTPGLQPYQECIFGWLYSCVKTLITY